MEFCNTWRILVNTENHVLNNQPSVNPPASICAGRWISGAKGHLSHQQQGWRVSCWDFLFKRNFGNPKNKGCWYNWFRGEKSLCFSRWRKLGFPVMCCRRVVEQNMWSELESMWHMAVDRVTRGVPGKQPLLLISISFNPKKRETSFPKKWY